MMWRDLELTRTGTRYRYVCWRSDLGADAIRVYDTCQMHIILRATTCLWRASQAYDGLHKRQIPSDRQQHYTGLSYPW
jgi:hypothetical protein